MSSSGQPHQILRRANPSTIQDKFMVGYQGWFTCGGDGEPVGPGHHGWLHWVTYPVCDGGRPNTDLWPDVSEYSPSELFPVTGLELKNGETPFVFSSRHPKTVQRHFNWMAKHGVDGAFLQRFAGQTDVQHGNEGMRKIRDEVGDRVREAAEREGRVFAICYDVSGVPPHDIERVIKQDWIYLIRTKALLDSPNYLREKGKPVLALWGFGMNGTNHCPHVMRGIIHFIRANTPGGAYIMAGTPAYWRTSSDDADRNPEFLDVWLNEFDAISPWTVGRYGNEADADNFSNKQAKGDVELLNRRAEEGHKKVDYIPVVLPGGSGFNLSEGAWKFNDMKRNGGKFLWAQIYNAKRLGVRTMYGAMWDEYDEGTAFMPVVSKKRNLPKSDKWPFLALDEEGYDLPSDWFMRICGFAAEGLRSERRILDTFPVKELQDYWSSRPKYEKVDLKGVEFVSGSSSGAGADGDGQTYQDWLSTQKEDKDEPPPPPYSLEAAVSQPQPQLTEQATPNRQSSTASTSSISPPPVPITTRPFTNEPGPIPPPSTRPISPPVVNTNSRPTPSTSSSISSLTEDFRRQDISSPLTMPSFVPPKRLSLSPPPVHPNRPGSSRPQSPYAIPQAQVPLPDQSYFNSQQMLYSPQSASSHSPTPISPHLPPRPPTASPQWPPADWTSAQKPHGHGALDAGQNAHPLFPQPYGNSASHGVQNTGQYTPPGTTSGKPEGMLQFPQAFGSSYPNQSGYPTYSPQQRPPSPYQSNSGIPDVGGPPAHPSQHPAYTTAPPPNSTSASPGPSSGFPFVGAAMSRFEKVAGKQTREQLESRVTSLASTGSKLFGKFTK